MTLPSAEVIGRAIASNEPDDVRARRLFHALSGVKADDREEALTILAWTLASHDPSGRLLRHLAGTTDTSSRLLALELASRLRPPCVLGLAGAAGATL